MLFFVRGEKVEQGPEEAINVYTGFISFLNANTSLKDVNSNFRVGNLINPLTLVKIGNNDLRPTPVDLEHWRNVFEEGVK